MSFEHLTEFQREQLRLLGKINRRLRRIDRTLDQAFPKPSFGLQLTLYPTSTGGPSMSTTPLPITSIALGGQAQLVAQLTENGAAYVPPAGAAPFTFAPTVVSSDANVTSAPATADVTAGAVPLSQQFLLSDASTDSVAAVEAITVSGTAPDGSTVTETINITVGPATPPPNVFGLSLTLFPAPGAVAAAAARRR